MSKQTEQRQRIISNYMIKRRRRRRTLIAGILTVGGKHLKTVSGKYVVKSGG